MTEFNSVVGVTGLNATDNPGPGISVIRALRDHPNFKGKIIGLAYDPLDPGLYPSNLIDSAYLMPFPSQGIDIIRQRLQYIRESSGPGTTVTSIICDWDGSSTSRASIRIQSTPIERR